MPLVVVLVVLLVLVLVLVLVLLLLLLLLLPLVLPCVGNVAAASCRCLASPAAHAGARRGCRGS